LEDFPQPQAILAPNPQVKEVDALYHQIKEQVESDLERTGNANEANKARLIAQAKERRLQTLLNRARTARSNQDSNTEGSRVPLTPQDLTKAQSDDEAKTIEEAQ
jgi:hypothetical protein